jgi:opacity protein-like surface antigen
MKSSRTFFPSILTSTIGIASLFAAQSAVAQWSMSADYTMLSHRADIEFVSIGAAYEYQFEQSNFSIMPLLEYGFGVGDDNASFGGFDFEVEAESFVEAALRLQYDFSDQVYGYLQAGYAELSIETRGFESDEWELGGGIGAGYKINDEFALEATYQDFDNTDTYTVGVRYRF